MHGNCLTSRVVAVSFDRTMRRAPAIRQTHLQAGRSLLAGVKSVLTTGRRTLLIIAFVTFQIAAVSISGMANAQEQQQVTDDKSTADQSSPAGASASPGPQPTPSSGVEVPAAAPDEGRLSPQAERVSQIAESNGDKVFLMVDKARGELYLIENGKPIVSGAALTGASLGDRLLPKYLTVPFYQPLNIEGKVTPAGRFTVKQERDPEYGWVWSINEVQGKDWDIAIHRVYMGTPSEHRDVRLRSPNAADRHITYGCINVDRSTILQLTQKLPRKGNTPIYILPQDEATTASFFPVRDPPPSAKPPGE